MKKNLLKESYLLFIIVIGLISLGCYSTYAMFTYSDETNDVISMNASDFSADIELTEYQTITISGNDQKVIKVTVSNSTSESMYYGVWYQMIEPLSTSESIIIAKLNTSLNETTGSIDASAVKDVMVIVKNKTSEAIEVNIGVKGSKTSSLGLTGGKEIISGSYTPQTASEELSSIYSKASKTSVTTAGGESITQVSDLGMMQDSAGNIRYYGNNPNNYVTFNGEEAGWRIIGVFDVEDENGTVAKRVKLIRAETLGNYSFDNKADGTGTSTSEYGSNDWSDSRLMILLNPEEETANIISNNNYIYELTPGLYWNSGSGSCYAGTNNGTTNDCDFSSTGLTDEGKVMIGQAKYSLLGSSTYSGLYADDYYNLEQTTGSVYGNHTTEWFGYIGLMYPSDYVYASDLKVCKKDGYNYNTDTANCTGTNWIIQGNDSSLWTISPSSVYGFALFHIKYPGYIYNGDNGASYAYEVLPVLYLSELVELSGGTGTESNPYKLRLGEDPGYATVNYETASSTIGNTYYSALTRNAIISSDKGISSVKYCTSTSSSCTPSTSYSITSGATSVTVPITFSSDSSAQKICIEATDLEGVVTTSCDNLSFRVDTSAPTSGISATGDLTTSIATVTASFSDSQSGMWKYDYYYGKSSSSVTNVMCSGTTATTCSKELSSGTYYFKIVGYNNAGKTTTSAVKSFALNSGLYYLTVIGASNNDTTSSTKTLVAAGSTQTVSITEHDQYDCYMATDSVLFLNTATGASASITSEVIEEYTWDTGMGGDNSHYRETTEFTMPAYDLTAKGNWVC